METLANFENLSAIKKITNVSGAIVLETELEELQTLLYYFREHLGYIYLLDIFATDVRNNKHLAGAQFELNYLIKNLEVGPVICIRCLTFPGVKIPSNGNIWRNCLEKEREAQEIMNVPFEFNLKHSLISHNNLELLDLPIHQNLVGKIFHPLLRNEVLWNFDVKDNFIEKAEVLKGYSHIGFEKSYEGLNSNEILMQISRLNCRRSSALETLWCDNIELSHGLEITDRACAVRMLFLEIERIIDHFNYFTVLASQIQYPQMLQIFQVLKQKVANIIPYYTGNKAHIPINCIGGIRFDIPRGWIAFTNDTLEQASKVLSDFVLTIEKSSIWKERVNCGAINSKDALDFGLSGPNLRASGVNFDLRKNNPYYFYSDIEFSIPVGQMGTALDRFLVRKEEVFQSLKIINQVLDNIPTGPIAIGDFNYFRNASKSSEINKELYMQTALSAPLISKTESVNFIEGSNGYMGLFLQGNEQGQAARVRISSGDQCSLDAYPAIVVGADYDDALLIYTSLNIHISEVEK